MTEEEFHIQMAAARERGRADRQPDPTSKMDDRIRRIAKCIVREWRAAGVGFIPESAEFINAINQLSVAIDPTKEGEWCGHCGCGNDDRGFAHLDSCPTKIPTMDKEKP